MTDAVVSVRDGQPAVCVKDEHVYGQDPAYARFYAELNEETIDTTYEGLQADFWDHYAPGVAREYGYGQVYSDGRSGGWLIVEHPPRFLDGIDFEDQSSPADDDCMSEAFAERERFLRFAADITAEIAYLRGEFRERLCEALSDLERRREESIVRGEN